MTFRTKPTGGISSTRREVMPAGHAGIPVCNAGDRFYEDFEVGHKIRWLRRTLSEGGSHPFNCRVLDVHPHVRDDRFADVVERR